MNRLLASAAGTLLLMGAVPAVTIAQGSFVTPPAASPAPQPKPKPKTPPPAAKKPATPAPAPGPAPKATKPAAPVVAPSAAPKPAERPKRTHIVEAARPEPIPPPPPPRPALPAGPVQVSAGGSLLVGGQPVTLAGLALRPTPDLDQRLDGWLVRNGGTVQCLPQASGAGYVCRTPYRFDLGTALVVSGFAVPQPDASDGLKVLAGRLQLRATILASDSSPALQALLAGTANPSCQNPFGCRIAYIATGYNRNNAAYARQDWAGLAEGIIRTNYQNDIDYFFLGQAAEAMGAYHAAAIYYQKAAALLQSYNANDHCSSLQGLPACDGINLAQVLPQRIDDAQKAALLEF